MEANYDYWNSITTARSLEVPEDEWLEGKTLLSIETSSGFGEENLAVYVKEQPVAFLTYLKFLTSEDRDLLFSSYCLGVTQTQLGKVLHLTQTVCSQRLRVTAKKLGFYILIGGHPTKEQMEAIMVKAGQDVKVATMVDLFRSSGSFTAAANQMKMHRPELRRNISHAATVMLDSEDAAVSGLGAYLSAMVSSTDPTGTKQSKAALRRPKEVKLKDPMCLGDFRVKVTDAGFDSWFTSKSTHYHEDDSSA